MIGSQFELNPTPNESGDLDEKVNSESAAGAEEEKQTPQKRSWWSWRLQPVTNRPAAAGGDPEKGGVRKVPRKLILLGPLYAGCGAALAMCRL